MRDIGRLTGLASRAASRAPGRLGVAGSQVVLENLAGARRREPVDELGAAGRLVAADEPARMVTQLLGWPDGRA